MLECLSFRYRRNPIGIIGQMVKGLKRLTMLPKSLVPEVPACTNARTKPKRVVEPSVYLSFQSHSMKQTNAASNGSGAVATSSSSAKQSTYTNRIVREVFSGANMSCSPNIIQVAAAIKAWYRDKKWAHNPQNAISKGPCKTPKCRLSCCSRA